MIIIEMKYYWFLKLDFRICNPLFRGKLSNIKKLVRKQISKKKKYSSTYVLSIRNGLSR